MPTQPQAPAKPQPQPPKAPEPKPPAPPQHQPPPRQEAARDEPPLPIGAKPRDPRDPQAMKFDPPPAPPFYQEPRDHDKERPAFIPKPALDPRAETPPEGAYTDGMTSAQEQRTRSAWIEEHGMKAYHEAVDDRSDEDKAKKQVPGVTPPTKRE
jgi:hypothetical protein